MEITQQEQDKAVSAVAESDYRECTESSPRIADIQYETEMQLAEIDSD